MSLGNRSTVTGAQTAPVPVVDPAQTQNRVLTERRRRLATGGTQSTFIAPATNDTTTISPAPNLVGG